MILSTCELIDLMTATYLRILRGRGSPNVGYWPFSDITRRPKRCRLSDLEAEVPTLHELDQD